VVGIEEGLYLYFHLDHSNPWEFTVFASTAHTMFTTLSDVEDDHPILFSTLKITSFMRVECIQYPPR
jgi:hypothetical protein